MTGRDVPDVEFEDSIEKKIIDDVENYGCSVIMIEDDGYIPSFAYTIGLYKKFSQPEIICFGLKSEVAHLVLNHALKLIQNNQEIKVGKHYSGFLEGYPVQFIQVQYENYPDYLGYAGWFNKSSWDFPVFQLVWPDKECRWPWENNFNPNWRFKQPLLDRNKDFKFYEPRNLGVYTTEEVLQGAPVLFVYHNSDGDWQFHSSSDPSLSKAKLVCMEDLVHKDETLNDLFSLQHGYMAHRNNKGADWIIEENPEENEEE